MANPALGRTRRSRFNDSDFRSLTGSSPGGAGSYMRTGKNGAPHWQDHLRGQIARRSFSCWTPGLPNAALPPAALMVVPRSSQ